jgi:hypothetical protein
MAHGLNCSIFVNEIVSYSLAHGAGKRYKLRTKPMQAQETL